MNVAVREDHIRLAEAWRLLPNVGLTPVGLAIKEAATRQFGELLEWIDISAAGPFGRPGSVTLALRYLQLDAVRVEIPEVARQWHYAWYFRSWFGPFAFELPLPHEDFRGWHHLRVRLVGGPT